MKLQIHIDGGARGNPGPAGAGVVVRTEDGKPLWEAGFFLGRMTNNMAEYHGLLKALDFALAAGASGVSISSDSELLVRQINGDYRVKNLRLQGLFDLAWTRLRQLEHWKIQHIYREQNKRADELANLAMDAESDVVIDHRPPPEPAAAPPPAKSAAARKRPARKSKTTP